MLFYFTQDPSKPLLDSRIVSTLLLLIFFSIHYSNIPFLSIKVSNSFLLLL